VIRALFVNSGILGQKTFARFIAGAFVDDDTGVRARQIVLSENLTAGDRALRRLLCARLWPDGLAGQRNLDLLRYRAEVNAGLLARKRIRELEAGGECFDVLHFHRQATAYASIEKMRATPSIVSIDCTQGCVIARAGSRLEARSYRPNAWRDGEIFGAARLIVAASEWAASSVRREYPGCRTEILVMPNPVQLETFDAGWIEERYDRAIMDDSYRPRVLFMGGDLRRKGGDVLLAAWRRGNFAGRAELDLVTHRPPRNVPVGVSVHLDVGAHSERWRNLWKQADVFALPTLDEAFGIVFQEAAAAGVPAIGTRINAIPELVLDGQTGLLVTPGDVEGLVAALDRLLDSASCRRELGRHARDHVVRTAHPMKYRESLAAAIRDVAGR
jgi:glycosyltransferase involved in cell wall biosynthesis